MKPFTPISDMHEVDDIARIHLSTSMDGEHLYLNEFIYDSCTNHRNSMIIDRPTAKWLRKQLKKALKTPEKDVS